MQSGVILLISALILVMCCSLASVEGKSSCGGGEYFGDFPQKINLNRKWEQEVDNETEASEYLAGQRSEFIVNLALLLPSTDADGEGCDDCVLAPVLPVIELAMIRAQEFLNDFMLENMDNNETVIRLRRDYGDTKCSSTIGPLTAMDMVTNNRPGRAQ